ncbi:unnamed protein product [Prunus armeniaca]|uniref:Protein BREAKING OF ASYMMETRY IN THE STOMATAL LINEAGE n=1 Tax=Prunus armeniaca TaxID=36596 RepID=A0A6J5XG65_PRUAR|nr:unnamed protein product [Prunus armeniaca]
MCSTPWTMTRLVRWRVKDWASCFLACRFSLDDEAADRCCPANPQLPIRNMAFDMQDDSRCDDTNRKKMSRHKKCSRERRLSHSSKQVNGTCPVESRSSNNSRCRPHFSDEEFIVFCFKEDGAFDVVKNGKPEAASSIDCTSRNSPRPVNRKDEEEEEENYLGTEPPPGSIAEDCRMVSVESSDSNQSDGSTGSFAFPVYVGFGVDGQSRANAKVRSSGIKKAQGSLYRLSVSLL